MWFVGVPPMEITSESQGTFRSLIYNHFLIFSFFLDTLLKPHDFGFLSVYSFSFSLFIILKMLTRSIKDDGQKRRHVKNLFIMGGRNKKLDFIGDISPNI